MREEIKTEEAQKTENMIAIIVVMVGSAGSMAMIGAVLCYMFGDSVKGFLGFQPAWWQGLLAGLLVGLVVGLIQAIVGIKRTKAIAEVSSSMGLKPLSADDSTDVRMRLRRMLSDRIMISDCYFSSMDGAHLVVGELTIQGSESRNSDGSTSVSSNQVQTCVFFRFDNFEFPQFELKPEGIFLRMLNAVMGVDIDFDDSPEFSKKYFLSGTSEADVRQLFSPQARQFFEQNLGLRVVAEKNQLIVFRPQKICKPNEMESLVQVAMNVATVLQENAEDFEPSQSMSKSSEVLSKAEALQQANAVPGIFGSLLRRQIEKTAIDQTEMDEFLHQPIPRKIPRQLKHRFRVDPFLMFFSVFFTLGGLMAFVIGFFAAQTAEERLIAFGLASIITIVGASVFLLCRFFNKRKISVLNRGEVIKGRVSRVEETTMVIGNQRVYRAFFHPESDKNSAPIVTKMHGCNIQRAIDRAETGEPMILLRDPENQNNTLLIECFML